MNILTFYNGKGGSCKSTTCLSLGFHYAKTGQSVLLVDLDPQGSLSRWVGEKGGAVRELLSGEQSPEEVVTASGYDNLSYVASNRSLGDLEIMRAGKLVRGLENLFASSDAEFVLIDPPPATGTLATVALLASKYVISPVEASMGAMDGMSDTLGLARKIGTPLLGAFACRVDERTRNDRDAANYLIDALGDTAFQTYIRETVKVREAMARRKPLPAYAPNCTASNDYANLSEEITDRLDA